MTVKVQTAAHLEKSPALPMAVEMPTQTRHEVHRSELLSDLVLPSFVFKPTDPWAVVFREGLSALEGLEGAHVCEVGVGAGANVYHLLGIESGIARIYGTDIDARVTEVAARNVREHLNGQAHKFVPIHGDNNLLNGYVELARDQGGRKLDVVLACIPQVKIPTGVTLPDDYRAHYYRNESTANFVIHGREQYDHYSLGLNAALLAQARPLLADGGRVVLNLGGRVPLEILEQMFLDHGYSPRVLYETGIEQDRGTSISELAEDERRHGIRFVFFDDERCKGVPINACIAEQFYNHPSSKMLFHKIYVIEGTKLDY